MTRSCQSKDHVVRARSMLFISPDISPMTMQNYYARQYQWRHWQEVLDLLPDLKQQNVLDLGCGIGDIARDLSTRGAIVTGIDANQELIEHAVSRDIPNASFQCVNWNDLNSQEKSFDGIWASFVAAYAVDLPSTLGRLQKLLRPGGWIALTEIDDLFGHHPLSHNTSDWLSRYAADALANARYDFQMGGKLRSYLERSNFTVAISRTIADDEFAFTGSAVEGVIEAWRERFSSMSLLAKFCGVDYSSVRDEFLHCLERDDHRAAATVRFCLAYRSQ